MSYNQKNRIFKVLYKRYFSKVRSRALRILSNEKDADDIAQEAFMRAYVNLDRIHKREDFIKWVYTVARNLSYNYKRDNRHSLKSSLYSTFNLEGSGLVLLDKLADQNNPLPDQAAERKELLDIFRDAMQRLSPNYRIALQLCGIDGVSYNDAALTLNTSVSVIAHNLMRAKKELISILAY